MTTQIKAILPVRDPSHREGMNGIEREYASQLELRRIAGDIADWGFERLTFKLARRTRYTPDFDVLYPDGHLELVELKATWSHGKSGWHDDSKVKFKVAREHFPMFSFIGVRKRSRKEGGGFEEIKL